MISNSFANAEHGSGARGYDTFEQAQTALDLCRTAPGTIADRRWPWFGAAVCNWSASEVTRRALPLLDDADGPFFLTLNYMDAHEPYYVERSCGEPNGYAAALRCLDRSLAPVVDWRSARRPTLLALVGDHGEQFGEHGLFLHGNSLYIQLLHVPLLVRPPERRGGAHRRRSDLDRGAAGSRWRDRPGAARRAHPLGVLPAGRHGPADPVVGDRRRVASPSSASTGPTLRCMPCGPTRTRPHDLSAAFLRDAAIDQLRAAIAEMRRAPRPDMEKFRSLGYIQ